MSTNTTWRRVTRAEHCPICRRSDWCLVIGAEGNPTAAICARIESSNRRGEAGWLHRLRDDDFWQPRRRIFRIGTQSSVRPNMTNLAKQYEQAITPEALRKLANSLWLSVDSLSRLCVGWSAEHSAFTFPMMDACRNVRGIRLRLPNGRKLSVLGGKDGLFISTGAVNAGPLLICEGPTDTAALLDLGFSAIGRPSCSGGVRLLVELARVQRQLEVVIMSDLDSHGRGQRGADDLAAALSAYTNSVRVIAPPAGIKDAREWKQRGATPDDLSALIDSAVVRRLSIRVRKGS